MHQLDATGLVQTVAAEYQQVCHERTDTKPMPAGLPELLVNVRC